MAKISISILNPWPFELNEVVTLHWVNSPIIYNQKYFIEAFFKTSTKIKSVEYSLEFLPLLYIGLKYMNGKTYTVANGLETFHFYLTANIKQFVKNASDVIPTTLYSFENCKSCLDEKCVIIEHCNKKIVFPCMEILRSVYTPNNFLANRVFASAGLEDLSLLNKVENDTLYIDFNKDYPTRLLTDKWINQYIWLKYSPLPNNEWYKIKNQYLFDEKIHATLPFENNECIVFEGLCFENYIFAINLKTKNTSFPFRDVIYNHPRLKDITYPSYGSKYRIRLYQQEEIAELINIKLSHDNYVLIESPSITAFKNPPTVIKKLQIDAFDKIPKIDLSHQKAIIPTIPLAGLEFFCNVIDEIRKCEYVSVAIDMKSFPYLNRRIINYAYVKLTSDEGKVINIVESGLEKKMSTIIFYGTNNASEIVNTLIESLGFSGHWSTSHLYGLPKYNTIPHIYSAKKIANIILSYFD